MKNRKKTQPIPLVMPMFDPLTGRGPIVSDPLGSYTGDPIDTGEVPVQDADDL